MTPEGALAALRARADPEKAARMAAYHKTTREVLGLPNPEIDALARKWRAVDPSVEGRVALADGLWRSGAFEACIAAAKLLVQARIRGDEPVWALVRGWVPDFDGWAVADAAAEAGRRRLVAEPARLDEVEAWTSSPHLWTRRAALVFTLPWAKLPHPSPEDRARRERVLGWAAALSAEREWFIQKAVATWLRALSPHEPERVRAFLAEHGDRLRPFARRDAARRLPRAV